MEPDSTPLFEILGMTPDELESMSRDFVAMTRSTEDLFELCKIIIDKYGLEAVFMSMNLFRILEMVRSERQRRIVKQPDKEAIDAWLSTLKTTMSDN